MVFFFLRVRARPDSFFLFIFIVRERPGSLQAAHSTFLFFIISYTVRERPGSLQAAHSTFFIIYYFLYSS